MLLTPSFLLLLLAFVRSTAAPTEPVFIATKGKTSRTKQQYTNKIKVMESSAVYTASDAAVALNSIQFMEMLTGIKNSMDVKTYTKSLTRQQPISNDSDIASSESNNDTADLATTTAIWTKSLSVVSRWFRRRAVTHTDDRDTNETTELMYNQCSSQSTSIWNMASKNTCPSHETVSEYVGRLWFLPDSKALKFRETIKIVSLSPDGNSSTVECNTEYHNGSNWVDCSKIVCRFVSVENNVVKGKRLGVKMTLDCELLVWLPLPKAASKAVGKKISSVFESVAIDYFEALAR